MILFINDAVSWGLLKGFMYSNFIAFAIINHFWKPLFRIKSNSSGLVPKVLWNTAKRIMLCGNLKQDTALASFPFLQSGPVLRNSFPFGDTTTLFQWTYRNCFIFQPSGLWFDRLLRNIVPLWLQTWNLFLLFFFAIFNCCNVITQKVSISLSFRKHIDFSVFTIRQLFIRVWRSLFVTGTPRNSIRIFPP